MSHTCMSYESVICMVIIEYNKHKFTNTMTPRDMSFSFDRKLKQNELDFYTQQLQNLLCTMCVKYAFFEIRHLFLPMPTCRSGENCHKL